MTAFNPWQAALNQITVRVKRRSGVRVPKKKSPSPPGTMLGGDHSARKILELFRGGAL